MSRGASPRRTAPGVLLDTSFILPVLGYDAGPRVQAALEALRRCSCPLYYSELSILEALWKIVKTPPAATAEGRRRVAEGVEALRRGLRVAPLRGEAAELAIALYRLGHRDMVDNLLYASARVEGLRLLTLDRGLASFLENRGLPSRGVLLFPEELEALA